MRKEYSLKKPLITISIVSHGDREKIDPLLDSLQQHEGMDEFQIILTDNLGDDICLPEDSKWESVTLIRNEKPLGFASNHNRAFQHAAGKYFCILNPDVLFEQKIFASLIGWLEHGQGDIVAPLIVDKNALPQDSFRSFPTPLEIFLRRSPGYRFVPPAADAAGLVRPDWIAGMFMLMKSATYREIRGFDERYRLYFEDVEFCARAHLAGLKLMVDTNVKIQHNAHRASRISLVYLLWHLQSAFRFFTSPTYKQVVRRLR